MSIHFRGCLFSLNNTGRTAFAGPAGPTSSKKPAIVMEAELERRDETAHVSSLSDPTVSHEAVVSGIDPDKDPGDGCEPNLGTELCTAACCASESECFHPMDKATLAPSAKNDRNFLPSWYRAYPWLSVCTTRKKLLL